MAFNSFANFGDIKGESTDKEHKDWVMILGFSHGVTQTASRSMKTAGGRSAEEVNHGDFVISKMMDAATPKLYEACCKGTHIPEVVIECWRSGGDKPVKYMEYKLKEVLISGIGSSGGSDFPSETVNMTYGAIEWTYTKQDEKGSEKGKVATKWNVAQGAVA